MVLLSIKNNKRIRVNNQEGLVLGSLRVRKSSFNIIIQTSKHLNKKRILYKDYIRKLDRVPSIKVFILYILDYWSMLH